MNHPKNLFAASIKNILHASWWIWSWLERRERTWDASSSGRPVTCIVRGWDRVAFPPTKTEKWVGFVSSMFPFKQNQDLGIPGFPAFKNCLCIRSNSYSLCFDTAELWHCIFALVLLFQREKVPKRGLAYWSTVFWCCVQLYLYMFMHVCTFVQDNQACSTVFT